MEFDIRIYLIVQTNTMSKCRTRKLRTEDESTSINKVNTKLWIDIHK